jgi:hypothetical protein
VPPLRIGDANLHFRSASFEERFPIAWTNHPQALRCYIQSKHDQPLERTKAYIRLAGLGQPNSKDVISDADEMSIYDEAAAAMSANIDDKNMVSYTCQMRLAAVKANTKNENLARDCFRACVNKSNWDYAQQVCFQ